jgi:hypothetical protein
MLGPQKACGIVERLLYDNYTIKGLSIAALTIGA